MGDILDTDGELAERAIKEKGIHSIIMAEDEAGADDLAEAFPEDAATPNLDDILPDTDAELAEKAITERGISAPFTEDASAPSMADPEGTFVQGEVRFDEPEFDLTKTLNGAKSNTANIAAEDEAGADDPASFGGFTDPGGLEPSGIPQTMEDPLTDPNLTDPGTAGQEFDEPLDV